MDDMLKELNETKNGPYLVDEIKFYINEIQKLVQAELDRTRRIIQLIKDYYHTKEGKEVHGAIDENAPDVLPGNEEQLPPVEREEEDGIKTFPRIELLYKNAIRVLNNEPIEDPRKRTTGFKKK